MKLKFGKYQNWDIEDVPDDYIDFMINSKEMWVQEKQRRDLIRDAQEPWVRRLIKVGYHELSRRHHPDAGGSHEDMLAINAAMAQLEELMVQLQG